MVGAIAPIAQRHVIVDTDEIDVRISPERIKVEQLIGCALGLIPVVFRPIGRIADFAIRPQDTTHLRGQNPQRINCGKASSRTPDLRQAAHFRPDAKRRNAPRRHA